MNSARPSLIACAGVGADEQGAVAEVAGHLGGQVRAGPLGVHVDDLHVLELGRPRDQGVEQDGRRGGGALDVDLVAGPDPGDGLSAVTIACGSLGPRRSA